MPSGPSGSEGLKEPPLVRGLAHGCAEGASDSSSVKLEATPAAPTFGWEPAAPILPITVGLCVHKGLEILFKSNGAITSAVMEALEEWARLTADRPMPPEAFEDPISFNSEQMALIEALLRAWHLACWDQFNADYEIIAVERELSTPLGPAMGWSGTEREIEWNPVILQSRCDLVVRSRADGGIYIPDWKVVKDVRGWNEKWDMEQQTIAQIIAVENFLGEEVAGCLYIGFIKGGRYKGWQGSPLLRGWKHESGTRWDCYEQRSKPWTKIRIYDEPAFGATVSDRIIYWLNWIPAELLSAQFLTSPPVFRNAKLIEEWKRGILELAPKLDASREAEFPAYRSSWACTTCWAKRVCYGEDEISTSGWIPHQDHHKILDESGSLD
jgi:hypothetical protein